MRDMPEVQFAEVNGIRLAFFEAGPKDAAAPPLVLCHGWPELAYSWRRQIRALSEAGYRVIAPDMRGFGLSPGPEGTPPAAKIHSPGIGKPESLGIRRCEPAPPKKRGRPWKSRDAPRGGAYEVRSPTAVRMIGRLSDRGQPGGVSLLLERRHHRFTRSTYTPLPPH